MIVLSILTLWTTLYFYRTIFDISFQFLNIHWLFWHFFLFFSSLKTNTFTFSIILNIHGTILDFYWRFLSLIDDSCSLAILVMYWRFLSFIDDSCYILTILAISYYVLISNGTIFRHLCCFWSILDIFWHLINGSRH